ncbi:hypothetical protein HMPREF0103_1018 [Bacteroides sp. 2_1_33B]|nr:hypothetical protein HMPREF0103_1018 [Bacteroides sp. 2_1_33B]
MFPQPDTGTELSAIGEGAGEGGEGEFMNYDLCFYLQTQELPTFW